MGNVQASRRYVVVAMTLDPALPPPWSPRGWSLAAPELDTIFERRRTAVRGFLREPGTKGWAKLGRITWSAAGHRKWQLVDEADDRKFSMADFAAPSLGTFDKTGMPPDAYANLFAHRERFAVVDGQWDTSKVVIEEGGFFVAIAVNDSECARVEQAAISIAQKWRAKAIGRKERTWAAKLGPDNATPIDPSMIQASLRPDTRTGWTMLG
jgi:hypothetical protein